MGNLIRSVVVAVTLTCGLAAASEVCPRCNQIHAVESSGVHRYVVNRDPSAYAHALREAQILAARGTAGHPLGCAPGCNASGTGYSHSSRPHHCFYGEISESRLVARAVVKGRNGAWYWSAHYRR